MRSLIILSILSMTVMASPVLLLFEDSAILMEDVSVDKTMNITIPENWDVMDVLGAESWYVLPQEKLSWEDVMKGKVVEIVENPPERSELVSLSPLVFRKGKSTSYTAPLWRNGWRSTTKNQKVSEHSF